MGWKIVWLSVIGVCLGMPSVEARVQAPHEYTTVNGAESATGDQSSNTLITPTSGSALAILGCEASNDAVGGTLTLAMGSTTIINGIHINSGTISLGSGTAPISVGAADEVLAWSTTRNVDPANATVTWSANCWGYEFRP